MNNLKIALVYDRVNKWGGAERDLLALHELFPNAPLYTAVYHPGTAPWAKVFPKVIPTFLNIISYFRDKHELLGSFTPIAFETLDFSDYDVVISVTSEAAKGIITKPGTFHICYCLTPTRYLWSHYNTYFRSNTFKAITKPVVSYLKAWDKVGAQRPDIMIAQSETVRERIKKYYKRDSQVIYPPVDIAKSRWKGKQKENYFLFVSRLVPYKKADLAIEAFNELGLPLVVVGKGSEEKRLKNLAKKNIEFVGGELTDGELSDYYQKAKALIFPGDEDFGMVMVEAQAAGTPVIAYRSGGALDIIEDGKTGIFFNDQTVEALKVAITKFEKISFSNLDLLTSAQRFSKERFQKEFTKIVKSVI